MVFWCFLWMRQAISAISAIHRAGAHYVLRSAKLCAERLFELLNKYAARKHIWSTYEAHEAKGRRDQQNDVKLWARSAASICFNQGDWCRNVRLATSLRQVQEEGDDKTCLQPTQISICQQAKVLHLIGWISTCNFSFTAFRAQTRDDVFSLSRRTISCASLSPWKSKTLWSEESEGSETEIQGRPRDTLNNWTLHRIFKCGKD